MYGLMAPPVVHGARRRPRSPADQKRLRVIRSTSSATIRSESSQKENRS